MSEWGASLELRWNAFWFQAVRPGVLGWIRAAVGLGLFWSLATYRADLETFFGPEGIVPVELVREMFPAQRSLLDSASVGEVRYFWGGALVVAALSTLGVGGRLVQIAALIAALSFYHRASLTNGPSEAVLAMLLAYLCIGRAGDDYSVTAWRRVRRKGSTVTDAAPLVSNAISLRLIQVHIAAIHWMMGAAQLAAQGGVWVSGEGMWLASQSPTSWGDFSWLASQPKVAALWSHLVTAYLWAFPLLAWRRRWAPALSVAGAIVWLSVATATGDGLFAFAMAAGSMAFWGLPMDDWPRRNSAVKE